MIKKSQQECKIISKKMKYGQLQKLKWYCQICEHQCNNEQAYRQHVQSEKHRIMMQHFRSNRESILKANSQTFESVFMDCLRRRFPRKEVWANLVYTQVIRDKKHVHLNSTYWDSLHGFCQHLANNGKVLIRMTERGVYIKYNGKEDENLDDEELMEKFERQKVHELEREKNIVKKMLESSTNNSIKKDEQIMKPIFIEPQDVNTKIVKDVKKTEKKVSSLFSKVSRPKKKEEIE